MIISSDNLIDALLASTLLLSIFSSAKSWKNHDYYAQVLGDINRKKEIRRQSEIFRYITFATLFFLSVFIVAVCRHFLTNQVLKASVYLGVALLTTVIIFILKLIGKIEFGPIQKSKNYSLSRIVTVFFVFLSISLLAATFYIVLTRTDVTFIKIIETYTK